MNDKTEKCFTCGKPNSTIHYAFTFDCDECKASKKKGLEFCPDCKKFVKAKTKTDFESGLIDHSEANFKVWTNNCPNCKKIISSGEKLL